jgi:hypothetical protein
MDQRKPIGVEGVWVTYTLSSRAVGSLLCTVGIEISARPVARAAFGADGYVRHQYGGGRHSFATVTGQLAFEAIPHEVAATRRHPEQTSTIIELGYQYAALVRRERPEPKQYSDSLERKL